MGDYPKHWRVLTDCIHDFSSLMSTYEKVCEGWERSKQISKLYGQYFDYLVMCIYGHVQFSVMMSRFNVQYLSQRCTEDMLDLQRVVQRQSTWEVIFDVFTLSSDRDII